MVDVRRFLKKNLKKTNITAAYINFMTRFCSLPFAPYF